MLPEGPPDGRGWVGGRRGVLVGIGIGGSDAGEVAAVGVTGFRMVAGGLGVATGAYGGLGPRRRGLRPVPTGD